MCSDCRAATYSYVIGSLYDSGLTVVYQIKQLFLIKQWLLQYFLY